MTTPDAGQRLIEDLRRCDPLTMIGVALEAADYIERLHGVEERKLVNDCRVGAVRIKAGCPVSTLIGAAERAESYRLKYGKCDKCGGTGCGSVIDALYPAIAASRSTGAADVGEDQ